MFKIIDSSILSPLSPLPKSLIPSLAPEMAVGRVRGSWESMRWTARGRERDRGSGGGLNSTLDSFSLNLSLYIPLFLSLLHFFSLSPPSHGH